MGLAFRDNLGGEIDPQVLVVADFLQMLREQGGKRIGIIDGIVLAFFLMCAQRLFHLLRDFREDIKVVQVRYGSVDDARPRRGIDWWWPRNGPRGFWCGTRQVQGCGPSLPGSSFPRWNFRPRLGSPHSCPLPQQPSSLPWNPPESPCGR